MGSQEIHEMKNIMQIFRVSGDNLEEIIKKAGSIIRQGGLVAFPTETVYGLGADALNPEAVARIFQVKGRPPDNPLIVHIGSKEQVHGIAKDISPAARKLIDIFWPGPLTMIFRRKEIVPDVTTCGLDTVAVRMPDHPVALALIKEAGTPIAAPSANRSGRPSPTTADHVVQDLGDTIDAVIDGGPVRIGVESTVLDLTSDVPAVLRPGNIGLEDIQKHLGRVITGYHELPGTVRSPGMKYTHYSPETRMVLIEGESRAVADRIRKLVMDHRGQKLRVGLLATEETCGEADEMFILGRRNDEEGVASTLFTGLRYLDARNVDIIIADGSLKHDRVGEAVLDRLKKAADEIIRVP